MTEKKKKNRAHEAIIMLAKVRFIPARRAFTHTHLRLLSGSAGENQAKEVCAKSLHFDCLSR